MEFLIGDPSKAREKLNWRPRTKFEDLVRIMMEADLKKGEYERKNSGNSRTFK